jgi:ABC-type branched-subunit amino acid transport system ATPase component
MYGFIGPSGAGKTTCIRMIMSILFPDAGTLTVLGRRSAIEAKDRIGYLPEERGVYRKMRVKAFLSYIGQLKVSARQPPPVVPRTSLSASGWAILATTDWRISRRACYSACSSSPRRSTNRNF